MLLLVVLAALGAVQAAFLLGLIAFRYRHHKNLPLGLLLLVFSLRLATIPTWNAEILLAHPWLLPATTTLPFLFGPLLWWYVREISAKSTATPHRLLLHFAPYLLGLAATSGALLAMTPAAFERFVRDIFSGAPPAWMLMENGLKVVVNAIYLVLAGRIAFGISVQRLAGRRRIWIQALVAVPALVLLAFAYVALLPGATAELATGVVVPFAILAFTMVGLIYLISLMVIIAPELSGDVPGTPGHQGEAAMSEEECRLLVERVERLLASGELRDPDLSLPDVAMQLRVHPNRLSYAINHAEGLSFRRFVNRHRIAHFIEEVESGALEESTILGLAFDVGFPSKSTFNRVFKEEVGTTPSDFVAGGRRRFGV